VPLPLPSDSADAPAANTHSPGPKIVLRIFTISSVPGLRHSCTQVPDKARAIMAL
jgi:hypothetical protein